MVVELWGAQKCGMKSLLEAREGTAPEGDAVMPIGTLPGGSAHLIAHNHPTGQTYCSPQWRMERLITGEVKK